MRFVLTVLVAAAVVFGAFIVCYAIGRWICGVHEDDDVLDVIVLTIVGITALVCAATISYVLYRLWSEVILPAIGIK